MRWNINDWMGTVGMVYGLKACTCPDGVVSDMDGLSG